MKRTDYKVKDINDCSSHERKIIDSVNKTLVDNFFKCAKWIKDNYPNMTETFHTAHETYYKVDLIIEDGVATLAAGSHNSGYEWYLSELGTGYYTQGSMQEKPYLFEGVFGMREDRLVKFLSEWQTIKQAIVKRGEELKSIYSNDFVA